jgi:hypothetical protein
MKKQLLMVLASVCFASAAQASLMIEPYVGYQLGSVNEKNVVTPANDSKGSLNGTALGARLGYRFLIPWIALDYTSFSGKLKPSNSLVPDADATQSSLAIVVGADLPVLLRAWAGYGFMNELKLKDTTTNKLKGSYTKVGLGWTMLPLVSLNFEYQMNNYSKYNGNDIKSTYSKFDHNAFMISLSLPLHF